MTIAIPVLDQHDLTNECVEHIRATSDASPLIIDNNSESPYYQSDYDCDVMTNHENLGYYYPLLQAATIPDPIIGLIHNDLFIYENGWDKRVEKAFADDPLLMLIGFCGSDQVDDRGGRGGGTMSNFVGIRGQKQAHTGRAITDLRPALILDSLAMIFRREAIPLLGIDETITPCHFYDKIWPLKLVEQRYRVGVMGISVDHIGGQTSVLVKRYADDCVAWCEKQGMLTWGGDAPNTVYFEAERRLFAEFGPKGLIPSRIDQDWTIHRNIGQPKYPHGI